MGEWEGGEWGAEGGLNTHLDSKGSAVPSVSDPFGPVSDIN